MLSERDRLNPSGLIIRTPGPVTSYFLLDMSAQTSEASNSIFEIITMFAGIAFLWQDSKRGGAVLQVSPAELSGAPSRALCKDVPRQRP